MSNALTRRRLALALAAGATALVVAPSIHAQQRIWDGGGTTNKWSDDDNWNNTFTGTTGNLWGFSTDAASPAAAAQRTTDMDQSYSLERVQFYAYNDWVVNSSNGSTLSLRGAGPAQPAAIYVGSGANGAAAATIGVPITFVARTSPDPNPKSLDIRAGSSLVLNNTINSGTYVVQKVGPGTITFNVASPSFTSEYRIANGTTYLANDGALGSAFIGFTSGNNIRIASADSAVRTLPNNISHTGTGGMSFGETGGPDMVLNGDVTLGAGASRTFGGGDDVTVTFNGNISGDGSASVFAKATAASFVLNGNVTGAALFVGNGSVVLNGNQSGVNTASQISTVSGGALEVNGQHAGNVNVGGGALRGTGSVRILSLYDGDTTDAALGGMLSPGSDTAVGTLTAGRADFGDGGRYRFNLANALGTPGTGWDLLMLDGNGGTANDYLNVSAGTGGFVIELDGLGAGFNPLLPSSFKMVDAGAVTGFDPAKFVVDASGFTPSLMGGSFSVSDAGGNLNVVFTPVPEPGTAGLLALASLALLRRRRRMS